MTNRTISYIILLISVLIFLLIGMPTAEKPHTHYEGYKYYNQLKKVPVTICLEDGSPRIISYKGEHLDDPGYPLLITGEYN